MNYLLKNTLKKNHLIVDLYTMGKQFYYKNFISNEALMRKRFKERFGRDIELDNPIKFNDKLQWLKLNWYDSLAIKCADKYGVREVVKEKIGEEYLNKIYGVYESVDEIDIEKLPISFVLKGTHGSGFNIICENKSEMNWNEEFKKMNRWLKTNFYWQNREWVYKDIKPRIICEKYIKQGENEELRDYRFFCFNGEPKFISVDLSITNKNKTRRNLYDLEWNLMDAEISYPKELSVKIDKPNKLNEMLHLSRILSNGFPHARVDFYYIREEIIFGEITFFHQSGLGKINPPEFDTMLGGWLKLPN